MAFTTSQAGIDLIKSFEDCRLTAYQDSVGVWTIGYGHTNGVYAWMTITQAQAEEFLRSELKTADNAVNGKGCPAIRSTACCESVSSWC